MSYLNYDKEDFSFGNFTSLLTVDANNLNFLRLPKVVFLASNFAGGAHGYPLNCENYKLKDRIKMTNTEKNFQKVWQTLEIFKKRFITLRSACSKCHVSEWKKSSVSVKSFFVGEDIILSLQKIKKDFATGEPSEKFFWKNINYINNRSCKMCHLVHQPAALIQKNWKQKS